jgi:hypothetical protein
MSWGKEEVMFAPETIVGSAFSAVATDMILI